MSDERMEKRVTTSKANDRAQDRISELPDSILVQILSFLRIENVVATGVLSRRWEHVWKNVTSLRFYGPVDWKGRREEDDRFVQFIHHTVALHESNTIEGFELEIPLSEKSLDEMTQDEKLAVKKLTSDVDVWLHFAVRRKVDFLNLNFSGTDDLNDVRICKTPYKLPTHLFCNYSIRYLWLRYCSIGTTSSIRWDSLEELHLFDVELSNDLIRNILLGGPLLKVLEVSRCDGIGSLDITSKVLRDLHLTLTPESGLTITAPYIVNLTIEGDIAGCSLVNVSSVVDVRVYQVLGTTEYMSYRSMLLRVLERIRHAKCLLLESHCLQVFFVPEDREYALPSLSCDSNTLTLCSDVSMLELRGIVALLRAFPNIQKLAVHIVCDDSYVDYEHLDLYPIDEEVHLSSLLQLPCLPTTLKDVKIIDFTGKSSEIALLEFLLKKAQNLQKVVLSSKKEEDPKDDTKPAAGDMLKLSRLLLDFQRASPSVLLILS